MPGRPHGAMAAALAVALAAAVAACGGTGGAVTPLDAGPADRLESLARQDQRLVQMAYRLSTANAELCPERKAIAGWTLHAAVQYGPEVRPVSESRFGLDRALPGVLAVAAGSPAEAAGLRAGDLLLSVEGRDLVPGDGDRQAFAGLQRNIDTLDAAMADGATVLAYRRGGEVRTTRLVPVEGCGYPFQLDPSPDRRARADGQRVFVTTAMMAFAPADPDLAFVLGHELAHNILGHADATSRADGGRGPEVLPWRLLEDEREADRFGLYLAARAGYPVGGASDFLLRSGETDWRFRYPQWGHDSAATRARAVAAAAQEITDRLDRGAPLDPRS